MWPFKKKKSDAEHLEEIKNSLVGIIGGNTVIKSRLATYERSRKALVDRVDIIRDSQNAAQDLKTELAEFKVEAMKEILELKEQILALEGQLAVVKQVTIGDLIDGGSTVEADEEFYDAELEFLRDIQHAHQYRPALRVVIGLGRTTPVENTPCKIVFASKGKHIEELENKYCLRLDGRIGYSNDVDTES